MAVLTDRDAPYGDEYQLNFCGEDTLLRKAEYIIEHPLYRYRPRFDRALDEIRTGRVYISDMDALNDPFDSSYAIYDSELKKELYPVEILLGCLEVYFGQHKGALVQLWQGDLKKDISVDHFLKIACSNFHIPRVRAFKAIKRFEGGFRRRHGRGYKVACFSETNNSIPMWAYYADNHKNICLEYDVNLLSPKDYILRQAFNKIHYTNYRPRDLHGEYSLVVKSDQWAHEKEWRLICRTKEEYLEVPCLSAVYLGIHFDDRKLDDVIYAIKDSGKKVKVFYCVADQTRYELKFIPLMGI